MSVHHVISISRPVQLNCYAQFESIISCFMLMFVGLVFGFLANYSWGRKLLGRYDSFEVFQCYNRNIPENYPGFFSFGRVSKAGVPREKAENTNFVMTVVGEGWAAPGQQDTQPQPGRRVVTTVSGRNIGYGSTCECLVQAGLAILREMDKMPNAGGVYTPGYAFADTSLAERLTEKGVTFSTVVQEIK